MTTTNKVWTARAKRFEDLEPQIQMFLDAHPAITIADTKFYQSHTGAREHNVIIFYQVAASSGVTLSTLLRTINKYAEAYNVDFNSICNEIKIDCTALKLSNDKEKVLL